MQLRTLEASNVVLATTVLACGALTPGYSQARDTVSRLGSPGQPFALLAGLGFVVYGGLVLLATPFYEDRGVARLVSVYGVAAVVAGLAAKDPPNGTHTLASQIHVDATIIGGIAITAAMLLTGIRSPRPGARRASLVSAVLTGSLAVAFELAWGSPIYGLVERAMLAVVMAWMVCTARDVSRQSVASATNVDQIDTHSFQTAGG